MSLTRAPARGRCIALTGACTFIGRNLVGVLEEDDWVQRIVTIDLERPDTSGRKTRLYDVDLTHSGSEERMAEILRAEEVDTLVHLAFSSSPSHVSTAAHELECAGTMHLLNAARESPLRHLVVASHTLLYGAHPRNPNFIDEAAPLDAPADEPFFADKIAAEQQVQRFASQHTDVTVAILRTAPVVGPTVQNFMTRYLSRRRCITLLGFDPLWQLLHEADAVAAFKLAIDRRVSGIFNIVSGSVVPLSHMIALTGGSAMPIPHPIAPTATTGMWAAQLVPWPPSFLPYLRYVCTADGDRAANELGFVPAYSSEDALLDFSHAQRMHEVRA